MREAELNRQRVVFTPQEAARLPQDRPYAAYICHYDWAEGEHATLMHCHERLAEVLLILKGSGRYTVDLRRYEVAAGDVVLCSGGALHDEFPQADQPYQTLCVAIGNLALADLPPYSLLSPDRCPLFHQPEQFADLKELFCLMDRYAAEREPGFQELCQHLMLASLELVRRMAAGRKEDLVTREDSTFGRVARYIDRHYAEDLSIEQLARQFYLSPYHLSHIFRQKTGYSLKQYVLRRRRRWDSRTPATSHASFQNTSASRPRSTGNSGSGRETAEKSGKKTCGGNRAVPPAGLSISFRQVYLYTLSSILSRRRMNREEIQMKRTWRKKIGAVVALLAAVAVLGTGCGADAAGAVESRTRETRALGLLLSREDTFLSELKADIEAEAAAQGYAVRYYNAGNDPETQLRQVHEALAEGVETLLVNLADGEDSEKVADIVGDAGVVLLNRAPGTAILNERMVFVGMDEAGSGALQGHALAEYFWETDHGTDIRYLLFQGMPGQENTDARSGTAVQSLLDDGFCPIAAADYQVCGFSRERARQAMAALLEQGVDFDCVICDNDEMALGVIEALEAAGRDPGAAPIVSVDHTAEGAAALESGKLYMTVDQNPEDQARAAVAAAVNLARGRAYDDGLRELLGNDCTDPEQPFVLRVPVEAVTA